MWLTESGRPPVPGSRTVCGYALKWNISSPVRPDYDEVFRPHSLAFPRPVALRRNHDKRHDIATTDDPAFRLRCDHVGLWVEFDCPLNDAGDDILRGVRFGEFNAWSISFGATDQRWDRSGHRPLRIISQANVGEVSLADRGAHQTTIGILSRMKPAGRGVLAPR